MADDRIKLGLDIGDSAKAAESLASSLSRVAKASQGVAAAARETDAVEALATATRLEAAAAETAAMDMVTAAAVRKTQAQRAMSVIMADATSSHAGFTNATNAVGTAIASADRKTGAFGRSILNTSYAVQDFTSVIGSQGLGRALGAVQNNVPMLVEGLVGGTGMSAAKVAGLAGAVSIVSVGVGLLIDNWDSVTKLWKTETIPAIPAIKANLEGLSAVISDVSREIDELTERSKTDALGHKDATRLFDLQVRLREARDAEANQKLVEGVAGKDDPATAKRKKAVADAIAAAGGGGRVADNLADNLGVEYKDAVKIVADAMRGHSDDIATLRKHTVGFAREMETAERNERNMANQERYLRAQAVREERAALAERREARRSARDQKNAADEAEWEKSTPEEIAQSEAIAAIQARGVGKDWSNPEWLRAASEAIAARDGGLGGRGAIDAGIRAVRAARTKRTDAAELDGIRRDVDRATGGGLTDDQSMSVAQQTQSLVRQGFEPMAAFQQAMGELMQANAELMNTMRQMQSGASAQLQQARWQRQRAASLRQSQGTLLNRGDG